MKKILLLGHKGFVGTGLKEYFQGRWEVIGWGREENLFSLTKEKLEGMEIDLLVNCAVVMERDEKEFAAGSPSDEVNVRGARHLAEVLKGLEIGWIQISTKDVFGNVYKREDVEERSTGFYPKFLVDDSQPFNPETVYGKSKLMAEIISASHPKSSVIRLSSIYIEHDHPKANWIIRLVKAIQKGETVTLNNGGKQFRDPMHVEDLGKLIENIVAKGIWGVKMNAGGGKENIVSVLEVVKLINPKAKMKIAPGNDFGFAFNNRIVASVCGWAPAIRLRDRLPQIQQTIEKELVRHG